MIHKFYLDKKIQKVIGKSMALKGILIFLIAISIFFIDIYGSYNKYMTKKNLETARESYGMYQFMLVDIPEAVAEQIKSNENIECSKEYNVWLEDYSARIMYVDNDYWKISNFEIIEGNTPANKNEILCDKRYLIKNNIEFSENGKSEIAIEGKKYVIAGVYRKKSSIIEYYINYLPIFIQSELDKEESLGECTLLCGGLDENEYADTAEKIADKYEISRDCIAYNDDVLSYIEIDEHGNSTNMYISFCDKIFIPLIIIMAVISTLSFYLLSHKTRKEIKSIRLIGISENRILQNVVCYYLKWNFIVVFLVGCASIIVEKVILKWDFIEGSDILQVVKLNLVYVLAGAVICYSVFYLSARNKSLLFANEAGDTEIKNKQMSIFHRTKFKFWRLASVNVNFRLYYSLISIVCISAAIVILSGFLYITHFVWKEDKVYYDYSVEYCYDDMMEQLEGSRVIYEQYQELLKHREVMDIIELKHTSYIGSVKKNTLSKEMINYLRESSAEKLKEYTVIDDSYGDITVTLIAADKNEQINIYGIDKDVARNLSEDECIAVNTIYTGDGYTFLNNTKAGDDLELQYVDNDVEEGEFVYVTLNVCDTVENISIGSEDIFYEPIYIVNEDVFDRMMSRRNYMYPTNIYINENDDGDKEKILDICSKFSDLELVDLHKYEKEENEILFLMKILIYGMFTVIIAVISSYIILSMAGVYRSNLKQTAIIKSMGVPVRKIFFINAYVSMRNILDALIVGNVVNIGCLYMISTFIKKRYFYMSFHIPDGKIILLPNLIVIIIAILSFIPMYLKIKKLNVISVLQNE